MKTSKILNLAGIVLIGLFIGINVDASPRDSKSSTRKSVTLKIDKPILDFFATAFKSQIDANDIVRVQKMLSQVDNITISFTDKDASDYQLKFANMDEASLTKWMIEQGYLPSTSEAGSISEMETETEVNVPWMENMNFRPAEDGIDTEAEVSVPWMEKMNFPAPTEEEVVAIVPWMENMRIG